MPAKPVTQKQFKAFQVHVNQRFNKVDKRFDEVDKKFDEVDKRFDEVDKRFDEVDKRFKGVDKQFEGVGKRFDAVLRLIDFRFDTFREEMIKLMDDKFVMFDRIARDIADHREEQIMIGKCIRHLADQFDNHEKRIRRLEAAS